MGEEIDRVTELVGSSRESIEDSVANALKKVSGNISSISWFKIEELWGELEKGADIIWQVVIRVGFKVEDRT